jgi:CO/xanthine dehydrogenase Mo-binding subunit
VSGERGRGAGSSVSRRRFLEVAALSSGGFALGLRIGGPRAAWAEAAAPADGVQPAGPAEPGMASATASVDTAFVPNTWVIVDAEGVQLVCPRNEMGQDVHTSLTMLLAEELAVDPRKVVITQAAVDPVYVNSLLGVQITGASTSVRDAWQPLREAGAAARLMLVAAAAERWQVPVEDCRAEDGHVLHSGGKLAYVELAADAARQPVPDRNSVRLALTPQSAFRVIGTALPRLDGADKARGRTVFGIDVVRPRMLYAALAACPVLGGKVVSFDAATALKRPGVTKVVNIDEGVAVIAHHWWQARRALADIAIVWDEGPAAKLDTAAIFAALEEGAQESGALVKRVGDAEAALESAERAEQAAAEAQAAGKTGTLEKNHRRQRVVEARYTSQLLAHATLEPQNCLAVFRKQEKKEEEEEEEEGKKKENGKKEKDAESGPTVPQEAPPRVEVWVSTQYPQEARDFAAKAAGVEPSEVRIYAQFIGGGFGRRLESDFVTQAVRIAKAVPGKPVKLIWSREDDTAHDFYRPPSLNLVRGALDGDRVVALTHKLVSPSVTARMFPALVEDGLEPFMSEGTANLTYAIPNLELRNVIREVGLRVGYWRSVSHALNAFAIESFLDELAHAAGRDPVAFRLAMLAEQPRLRTAIDRASRDAGFVRAPSAPHNGRAFGIAAMECYGTYVALVAEVSGVAEAVKIEKLTIAADCGITIHPDQAVAQLESGVVTGLINTLRAKITLAHGRVEQANFDTFPIPSIREVPPIEVIHIESGAIPGGLGEVGTPLVAPAIANAVFELTGKRIRSLPLEDGGVRFV